MKLALTLAAAVALLGAGAGQSLAGPQSVKTVTVVMHDPGCHWFAAGGKFTTTLSVHGPVKLANFDEAALKVVGPHGTQIARVGKSIFVARGVYRITMVGQAPDDNHLKLTVS